MCKAASLRKAASQDPGALRWQLRVLRVACVWRVSLNHTPMLWQLNRVRANFWGLSMPSPVRSLWLLVREQYLCLEDLRLGYSILRGDVKVPGYWHTCFRDGLVLLTEGLDDQNLPLELVPVTAKVMLPYWDGSRREKEVTTSYFSDGHVASDGSGSRRGKVVFVFKAVCVSMSVNECEMRGCNTAH